MTPGLIQEPTSFSTVQGAVAAVRCWVDAAEASGHRRSRLCATLNVGENKTTALLGTRPGVMALLPFSKGGVETMRAVLTHARHDALIVVAIHDGPISADALSNIDAVLAVARSRAATQ